MNKDTTLPEKAWKVLQSEYRFKRPWLTVRCDTVQLPTGAIIPEYYVMEFPDWVNTLAITSDGTFVMVRQYRHGLRYTGPELCAGVCEPGETPEAAARRELLEETGYGNGSWSLWMEISANPGNTNNLTYCFLATGVQRISNPHPEPTEDLSTILLSPQEVYTLLCQNAVKQSLMAAPLWKYFALYGHPDTAKASERQRVRAQCP